MSELKEFWEQMLAPLQTPAISVRPAAAIRSELDEELEDFQDHEDCTNSWAITASTPDSKKVTKKVYQCHDACLNNFFSKNDLQFVPPQYLLH